MKKVEQMYYGVIYKHTTPSGKCYIGQTTKNPPQNRWRYGEKSYGKTCFAKAIKKYGFDNIQTEILWELENNNKNILIEQLNLLEELEIIKNNSLFPNGYNFNSGGKNYVLSEEGRKRLGNRTKIMWQTKDMTERNKKVSESNKHPKTLEHRKNISLSKRGVKNPRYGKHPWNYGKKMPYRKGWSPTLEQRLESSWRMGIKIDLDEAYKLRMKGLTFKEIGQKFNTDRKRVSKLLKIYGEIKNETAD